MQLEIRVKPEQANIAILGMLVEVLATQQATAKVLIEAFSLTKEKETETRKLLSEEIELRRLAVLCQLNDAYDPQPPL